MFILSANFVDSGLPCKGIPEFFLFSIVNVFDIFFLTSNGCYLEHLGMAASVLRIVYLHLFLWSWYCFLKEFWKGLIFLHLLSRNSCIIILIKCPLKLLGKDIKNTLLKTLNILLLWLYFSHHENCSISESMTDMQ